jgi:putative SOS response-associated peptidase YedK
MCGRYVRRSDKQKIAEYFQANPNPAELPMPDADYNIAPTTISRSFARAKKQASEK